MFSSIREVVKTLERIYKCSRRKIYASFLICSKAPLHIYSFSLFRAYSFAPSMGKSMILSIKNSSAAHVVYSKWRNKITLYCFEFVWSKVNVWHEQEKTHANVISFAVAENGAVKKKSTMFMMRVFESCLIAAQFFCRSGGVMCIGRKRTRCLRPSIFVNKHSRHCGGTMWWYIMSQLLCEHRQSHIHRCPHTQTHIHRQNF